MLTRLTSRVRDSPATYGLAALWLAVFLAMTAMHFATVRGLSGRDFMIGLRVGHRFGDMTVRELFEGEVWRTVTATFVHYGWLHIGLNLIALIQLGCLIESWYGPGQFLAIYVVTGAGGNALSGLMRRAVGADPDIESGGGSTVIMGLVGLCAVVGWRSRTRDGASMRNEMILAIGLTAALGLILPLCGLPIIDNWGHAGGTIMGVLVGFADARMLRQVGRLPARVAGALAVLVMAASACAQVTDDRRSTGPATRQGTSIQALRRAARDVELSTRLEEVRLVYRAVALPRTIRRGLYFPPIRRRPGPSPPEAKAAPATSRKPKETPSPPPAAPPTATAATRVLIEPERQFFVTVIAASAFSLDSMGTDLDTGENSADYRRAREILRGTASDLPTIDEVREFDDLIQTIRERLRKDGELARKELPQTP